MIGSPKAERKGGVIEDIKDAAQRYAAENLERARKSLLKLLGKD